MKEKIISQIAFYSFYIGVVIETLIVIIDKSAYTNPIEGQLFRLTFLLFLIKVCFTKYSSREYAAVFLFCLLGGVSYFATGRNEVIRFVVFMAACKDIDVKRCLKLVFYLTLIGCLAVILLSVSGIYGDIALTQEYGRGEVETRYTLGMGHPNALHCMVWALITLYLYLYGERMKWYNYMALMAVNVLFFYFTDSRTSFLVIMFILIFTVILKYLKKDNLKRIWMLTGYIIAAGSILVSIIIAANAYKLYNYIWNGDRSTGAALLVKLNDILNGRIRILVGTTRFEGTVSTWSLFSDPANNYYFDMGWIRLFYWYGIVPAGIFAAVLLILMIYCFKKKDYMSGVLIISFAVYHIMEAHGMSVYLARNYLLFLIGGCWYKLSFIQGKAEYYFWNWKMKFR